MAASKRRATRTKARDGVTYRSGFEAQVANVLLAEGVAPHYETEEIKYELTYLTDFAPRRRDGKQLLLEAKGYFPVEDRRKILAVLGTNPKLRSRFYLVFQNPRGKVTKTMTAAQWASKHGIKWATVDDIPGLLR